MEVLTRSSTDLNALGSVVIADSLPVKRRRVSVPQDHQIIDDIEDNSSVDEGSTRPTSTTQHTKKSSTDNKGQATRDRQWDKMFELLLEYEKQNGHCKFPLSQKVKDQNGVEVNLGKWIGTQRLNHRKNLLTGVKLEKLQALVDSGKLDWGLPKVDHDDERWEQHFNLLLDFRKTYGHCNVSERHTVLVNGDKSTERICLGKWLERQRGKLKSNTMRPDRLSRLTDLISEGVLVSGPTKEDDLRWQQCFSALVAYGEIFRHCNVPYKCEVEVEWEQLSRSGDSNGGAYTGGLGHRSTMVKSLRVINSPCTSCSNSMIGLSSHGSDANGVAAAVVVPHVVTQEESPSQLAALAAAFSADEANTTTSGVTFGSGISSSKSSSSSSSSGVVAPSASATATTNKVDYGYDDINDEESDSSSSSGSSGSSSESESDTDEGQETAVPRDVVVSVVDPSLSQTSQTCFTTSSGSSGSTSRSSAICNGGSSRSVIKLGKWLAGQRHIIQTKKRTAVRQDRQTLLQGLVDRGLLRWGEVYLDKTLKWEASLEALLRCELEPGQYYNHVPRSLSLPLTVDFYGPYVRPGVWLTRQLQLRATGKLLPERESRLQVLVDAGRLLWETPAASFNGNNSAAAGGKVKAMMVGSYDPRTSTASYGYGSLPAQYHYYPQQQQQLPENSQYVPRYAPLVNGSSGSSSSGNNNNTGNSNSNISSGSTPTTSNSGGGVPGKSVTFAGLPPGPSRDREGAAAATGAAAYYPLHPQQPTHQQLFYQSLMTQQQQQHLRQPFLTAATAPAATTPINSGRTTTTSTSASSSGNSASTSGTGVVSSVVFNPSEQHYLRDALASMRGGGDGAAVEDVDLLPEDDEEEDLMLEEFYLIGEENEENN